jgi:hypothetical protein
VTLPAPRRLPRALDGRVLITASVLLAALSLTVSRSPAYDVWTWLLWGREIAHGDLVTSFGPQFKPLPVAVATLASPFGAAAVPIWMFVAHAAGLLGIGATGRLAWRAAGPVAAVVACVSLISIQPFTFYLLAYGMSEPMLVALVFWAVDRHCDGRRPAAFVLLVGAALLRPEVWPFLLAYAVVLYRRRQARPLLLVSLLLVVPAGWFLPEWWGSGNPFRTGGGKALPGGPSTTAHPGVAVVLNSFDGLLTWVWVGALIGVVWAGWARDRLMLWLAGIGVGWLAIIAALAEAGRSSGVTRYLIISQAVVCVFCGAGWVKAVELVRDRFPRWRVGAPLLVAALAVPSLITLEGWSGDGIRDVRYQEGAYEATAAAVKMAGGAVALNRCGAYAWSAAFREPELAWLLRKHLAYVRSEFTPDLPAQAPTGPLVQITLRGRDSLLPKPFALLRYREVSRASSHGVAGVVLDPC